jgi:hypothetical protein
MKTVPLEDLIACGARVAQTVVHDHTRLSCSCTAVTRLESRQFVEVTLLTAPGAQTPLFRSERLNLNPMDRLY